MITLFVNSLKLKMSLFLGMGTTATSGLVRYLEIIEITLEINEYLNFPFMRSYFDLNS